MDRRFNHYVVPRSIQDLLDDDLQEQQKPRRRQRRLQTVRQRT